MLGCEVGAIANSLVFDADGAPLLVLASGAHRVDTAKVAALVGAQRVRRASPAFVFDATGQGGGRGGGRAPRAAAHRRRRRPGRVPSLGRWRRPHDVLVTYQELLDVTGGEAALLNLRRPP